MAGREGGEGRVEQKEKVMEGDVRRTSANDWAMDSLMERVFSWTSRLWLSMRAMML